MIVFYVMCKLTYMIMDNIGVPKLDSESDEKPSGLPTSTIIIITFRSLQFDFVFYFTRLHFNNHEIYTSFNINKHDCLLEIRKLIEVALSLFKIDINEMISIPSTVTL